MKILVVTNYYPPHHIGGYELGCRDVVEKLRGRGHTLHVLTGTFRHRDLADSAGEPEVERVLHLCAGPGDSRHNKRAECAKLTATLRRFNPDVVYFWNQGGLCLWLPLVARWHGTPAAFFLSDTNFVSWRIAAWLRRWNEHNHDPLTPALSPLGRGEGEKEHNTAVACVHRLFGKTFLVRGWPVVRKRTCHFCSNFLQQTAAKNEITVGPGSLVAHWGIELSQFTVTPRARWPVRRLLYAGQMIPQKGVHTAIAAFALVAKEPGLEDLTFSLAGGGMQPDYEEKLRALPAQLGIAGRVHFLGKVPRTELPRVYAEYDVLVFPSEWDEPFAITPLEAMASGLAVVGTTTGGSGELFRNRETAMTFTAGEAADCARALRELVSDRELFETITHNAQREVREKHTLDAMVDRIEGSLLVLTGRS